MAFHHSWKYDRVMNQLKMLHLQPETTWVDAGCGTGTFSHPISMLVKQVIAVDRNHARIAQLKEIIPDNASISFVISDFNHDRYTTEPVDGILFGFSLHYQSTPQNALNNAYQQLKTNGQIVVFEYCRKTPLPWVPYPFPLEQSKISLTRSGFTSNDVIFQNDRFYILKGRKSSV